MLTQNVQYRVAKKLYASGRFKSAANILKPENKDQAKVIEESFQDQVISDNLADLNVSGDLIPAEQMIESVYRKMPELRKKNIRVKINPKATRIRIYFTEGGYIEVPAFVKKDLSEIMFIHELSHLFYTKDLLNEKILKHPHAAQVFTVLRVLEDVSSEKQMESEYSASTDVFRARSKHVVPYYQQFKATPFGKQVDKLFLYLRGYSKAYNEDPVILEYAGKYLNSKDPVEKVDAVIKVTELLLKAAKR